MIFSDPIARQFAITKHCMIETGEIANSMLSILNVVIVRISLK